MTHQLSALLAEKHWDAALVCSPANIRYLTGFTGSNALVLVLPGEIILFTDPRYITQSATEYPGRTVIVKGPLEKGMKRWISRFQSLGSVVCCGSSATTPETVTTRMSLRASKTQTSSPSRQGPSGSGL